MASRTQIRLEQLTGSLAQNVAAGASLSATSLKGVLDAVASGLHNITGQDFYNVSDSVLKDQNNQSRISYADGAGVIIGAEGDGSTALTIGSSVSGDKLVLFGGNAKLADAAYIGSTTTADLLTFNANSVQVKAAKDLLVDEILESTSAAGVTIDGVLLKDNNIIIPDGSTIGSTTTAGAITIAANGLVTLSGDLTVSGNDLDFAAGAANIGASVGANNLTLGGASSTVVVAGNLTVNGTTTTVSTANLLVEDKLVTLNDGGAAASGGGSGIEIEEDSSITGYFKVASDRNGWELKAPNNAGVATFDVAATKLITITGDLNIEGDSAINQDVTSDANVTFASVTANGGLIADNITIDGTEIDLSSGDLTLDVAGSLILDADTEIQFKDGGTLYGTISGSLSGQSAGLYLSASAGGSIYLDGNGQGAVFFSQAGSHHAMITLDSGNSVFGPTLGGDMVFVDDNLASPAVEIFRIDASAQSLLVGTSKQIQFSNTDEAIYSDGTNLFLKSGGQAYSIPTADGTNGQVLKTNGNGALSFGSSVGDLARFVYKATGTVAAGNVDFGSSKTVGIVALGVGTANLNVTKGHSELNDALEVYVNGQLLVSGSDGGADTDYTFIDADTLKFAFGLEADDVIQIIQR